jgi:Ca2+-binding EF-hand superfamily protein
MTLKPQSLRSVRLFQFESTTILTNTCLIVGEYFRYFDKDGSGSLNEAEFDQLCKHMTSGGYDLKRLNFNIYSVDKDFDGLVTFNEFICKMIDLGALDAADGTRPTHG